MPIRAVLLDFYGTLAEAAPDGPTWDEILAEAGHRLDPEARRRLWNDGLDGIEHDEHSRSRDHYVAWQEARTRALLAGSGIPECDHDHLVARLHRDLLRRRITAYDEVAAVLAALRGEGIALAICSNWDWDLHRAVAQAGVDGAVDAVVSSAWVGARKPHPRIYRHTLEALAAATGAALHPDEILFVGDTWTCDVEGPRAAGMRPVYLRRDHFGPDATLPGGATVDGVARVRDLHAIVELAGA
jgi:putative hydrolase of the HAD superfamily